MAKQVKQRNPNTNPQAAQNTNAPVPQKPAAPIAKPRAETTVAPRIKKGTGLFGKKEDQLTIGRENYKWGLIGLGVMTLGFLAMSGGAMPSPDVWDESLIYSPMRIIVAPFLIIAGLVVVTYSIFVKPKNKTVA